MLFHVYAMHAPIQRSVFSGNIVDMGGSSGFATSTSGDLLHHPSVDDGICMPVSLCVFKYHIIYDRI